MGADGVGPGGRKAPPAAHHRLKQRLPVVPLAGEQNEVASETAALVIPSPDLLLTRPGRFPLRPLAARAPGIFL